MAMNFRRIIVWAVIVVVVVLAVVTIGRLPNGGSINQNASPITPKTMSIKIYLGNTELGSDTDCRQVFPLERTVAQTDAVGRASIEELLLGPTSAEKRDGYFSSIPSGAKLNSLTISDGVAKVDFNNTIEAGGSCRVSAIRAQVIQTLKQFATVREVEISVEGRVADALQP